MQQFSEFMFADQEAPAPAIQFNAAVEQFKKFLACASNGVVTLKPTGAKVMLERLNFPHQRVVDASRVFTHQHALRRGDWMQGHAITFVELPDGRIWLVDGQHRLTAISQWDSAVPVTIRLVQVESEKEARQFYAGFDQKTSVRTTTQILDAVGIAKAAGLSDAISKAVFEASTLLANGLEPLVGCANARKHKELFLQSTRMDAVAAWAHEARTYEGLIAGAKAVLRSKLLMPGVTAVALYTLRHQPVKAVEFWQGVANNNRLASNDPRAALIADLLTRRLNAGSVRQRVQMPVVAWNAFFKNRTLQQIKCVPDAPIVVLGTPLKAEK